MTDLFVCGSGVLSLAQFINSTARGLLTNAVPAHANYWTMVSLKPPSRSHLNMCPAFCFYEFFVCGEKIKGLKVEIIETFEFL